MTTKKSKEEEEERGSGGRGVRVGRYELGRTLGEGNFGKVKLARRVDTDRYFAVKVLERKRVLDLHVHDQIKREIATLKLLRHPNVVRLYEVLASKTKIYMVLEYVNGGELFDKIESKGRLSEHEGRKLFQQIIDAVSYCHDKGVFHRDLKPENVLLDEEGNVKISDFGLSALPQQFGHDGLLHTTCGSPNYVAPEVLANRGYDGAKADIWSCGVVLYVILTGSLPFDDRNLAVLYQKLIQKGDVKIPRWLSSGAQNMIRRILDPNPQTRMSMVQIKENEWFNQGYVPVLLEEEDDDAFSDDGTFSIKEVTEAEKQGHDYTHITAFELIGMSSCLDLSGFFEKEDSSERKIRFTSSYEPRELFEKIEDIVEGMGFQVHRGHGKLKITQKCTTNTASHEPTKIHSFSVTAEVFELGTSLYVVELRKSSGDSSLYRQLCAKLSDNLRNCDGQEMFLSSHLMTELIGSEGERSITAAA